MRKRVLPELIQMNPQAVQHMQTAMEQLQQVRDYLEEETVSLEKNLFPGRGKCETGYGRAGRAFAGCPDAADPQSCLESCRGMQRYYGGTFAGSGGPSGKQTGRYVKLPYGLTATRVYNVIEIMGKERKGKRSVCR